MGLTDDFVKKKIERLKEQTKPADALPIIKEGFRIADGTQEEKDRFIDSLYKGFEAGGVVMIDRALTEEVIDDAEYLKWEREFGLEPADICPVLQGYFNKKDGHFKEDDKVVCVTSKDSQLFKHKSYFEEKFGVTIVDPVVALKMMEESKDDS